MTLLGYAVAYKNLSSTRRPYGMTSNVFSSLEDAELTLKAKLSEESPLEYAVVNVYGPDESEAV